MKPFGELLDRLVYTPARNGKLRLIEDYLRRTPDPDRGYALAALTDGLPFSFPVRRTLLELMERHGDAELFRLSRDYVGDTAETVALMWPEPVEPGLPPTLADVVTELSLIDRGQLGNRIALWLDGLDAVGRWALLKLLTGGLRVGVSARLAKTAAAALGSVDVSDIEEVWHGLKPPYTPLFAWLEGKAPRPESGGAPVFRPMMLAHPIEPDDWASLDLSAFAIEWKWDGIRVQIAAGQGSTRLYSRTGDDIGDSFPELIEVFRGEAVLDGELLIVRDGTVAPFNDLQQRLNRRAVSPRLMKQFPAHVRLYDALQLGGEDLRALPFSLRRRKLEDWHARLAPPLSDLSDLVTVADKAALEAIWSETRASGIEGLMLKRQDSPYLAGRPRGHWFKWKRRPLSLDFVLMYAQRGSGKRSSFYSDFTFGAWTTTADGEPLLVPVGKAYSGFTDAELRELDRFVRAHTVERYGPVRALKPQLVVEVAFDAAHRSARHKSGVALRFPRFARIRWDKPADEAEQLNVLINLIDSSNSRE